MDWRCQVVKGITDVAMITSDSRVVMIKFLGKGGIETRYFKNAEALLRHLIVTSDDFEKIEEMIAAGREAAKSLGL